MKRILLIFVTLISSLSVDANAADNTNRLLIFNLKDACRMQVEEFAKIITIPRGRFRVEIRDTPEWGHDEDWDMLGKDDAKNLGLKGISISIEQGMFRAVYFFPDEKRFTAGEIFARSLKHVGLKRGDLTGHKSKTGNWFTARDSKGLPISIGEDGSRFECFEHHPGH